MRYKLMFFILVTGFFTESLSTTEPGEILVTSTETPGLEPDVGDVITVTTTDEINDGNDFITTTDVPDATTLIEEVTFQTEPDITTEAVTEQSDDNDKISSIENSNLPLDSNLTIQQKNLSNSAISNINLDSEKKYPTENPETSLDEEPVDKLVGIENEPTHHDDKPVDLENPSLHHDKPEARENESTPHAISKRILISSTTDSINNPINLHEHSEASLDSWRPVRPPVESSIRFPSETSPQPVINSFSNPRNNYPVSKEPVTAYYFDLTSAAPYPPRGPLFDPSAINDFSLGVSSEVVPKDNIEQNLSTRVHDSVSQPTGIDQNVNPEDTEDSKDNIKPTPTQPITNFTPETNESTLNIDHGNDLPATRRDNISSQGVELETIPSLYNRTATDFQQSTPAYTLGLSTDFHFTLGESDAVKNSTNILGPDSMPSTLSSDQPLETHNSTGDHRNKNEDSFTTAALPFNIPILPTDLPSPISLTNVIRTRENPPVRATLVSRIPLWKRLSQSKSLSAKISNTPKISPLPSLDIPASSTLPFSYNGIPFENDIPIGILSPGILKHPARPLSNDFDKKDAHTVEDIQPFLTDASALPISPTLESSIQSSTVENNEEYRPTAITIPSGLVNIDSKTALTDSEDNLINFSPTDVYSRPSTSMTKVSHPEYTESKSKMSLLHESHINTAVNSVSITRSSQFAPDDPTYVRSGFTPMFTRDPFNNISFVKHNDTLNIVPPNITLHYTNDSSKVSPTPTIDEPPINENDLTDNVATNNVDTPSTSTLEKPALINSVHNEINTSSLDKTEISTSEKSGDTENFEGNTVVRPPSVINNSIPPLSIDFDNFTEKPIDKEVQPTEDSFELPTTSNKTGPPQVHLESPDLPSLTTTSNISSADVEHSDSKDTAVEDTSHSKDTVVVEDTSDSKDAAAVEDTQESHDTSKDDSKVNVTKQPSEVLVDHSSDSTSTTVTPSSPKTKSPSSSTTLSSISPSTGSTTEREPPSDLKIETNTTQNGTFYEIFSSTTEESSDESDTTGTRVKVNVIPGDEPALHLWKMHQNGTNTTHSAPFIKAEVSYDNEQFCWHQSNIEALLRQWINLNLNDNDSEIEIFEQPDCLNLNFSNTKSDDHNVTNVYFYVKRNGTISLSSTRKFPIHPTGLGISQELEYLREKIRALELKDEESQQEISENTSNLVVVAVVAPILVIILVGAILACFIVKRRRSAETIGRRCTPAANDAYSLDSVSVFYHSLRRKSKKRASNKSLKSYLNQGFDDPNQPSRQLSFAKLTLFITDNEAINDEFSNIPSIVPKYDEMPRGVEDKNRYANVIPVPETRILLGGSKISPSAEYINANSIHGPKGELRYYIATQAPLDNTVADFWQMVWEQESKVIVMLTDFVEKGIDKCADYLPPSETLDCHRVYGEFQITLKSRDMREKYIMSLLQIKNLENNLVREIAHMWFTGWPQSGVPNEEKLFMNFIFDVRTTRKQLRAKGPIIVHCSPGTGRTGTYIACDLCMKQFDDQKVVDVPKTVFRIRRERAGAVQTKEQYSFIYRVVNFYAARLTTGNLDSF